MLEWKPDGRCVRRRRAWIAKLDGMVIAVHPMPGRNDWLATVPLFGIRDQRLDVRTIEEARPAALKLTMREALKRAEIYRAIGREIADELEEM